MDLHPVALIAADAAVVIGFLALITRPFRKRLDGLATVLSDIREVKAEVLPNHGSSLRDAVDRIERDMSHVKEEQSKQSERMDDHIAAHFRA